MDDPAAAVSQLEVDTDLAINLFAAEPMLANPTSIDVDERGRVWVCEAVNYRAFRNADIIGGHTQGDRIVVLEDSDSDAKADRVFTYYQGHDVDAAHGVMVMPTPDGKGARVLVAALDSVFFLIDDDGDLRADRKELLFSGIEGAQNDHGIHSFHFGPDGKLYFNFGNAGKTVKDKHGKPIVDKMGHVVDAARQPYQEGMVFRCNVDGSEFETLAWNFRNCWEVCVDSYGTMWQSDNDDDGNRACRLNYVMEYGNYGYKDEMTGAAWSEPRTNREADIPRRHWHQDDPGVVPNMHIFGAGAPAGLCVYEGDLLPPRFRGALVLAEPGTSSCQAYAIKGERAGYSAHLMTLVDGAHNQWFRPSDVCVAPDGSLMIADWCDPGVGGHRMQDIARGRIYRLTPKGPSEHVYTAPAVDTSSADAAVQGLKSPNIAARCLAWTTLQRMASKAVAPLQEARRSEDPALRARAIWLLGKLAASKGAAVEVIRSACLDRDPDIRVTGVRLARQTVGKLEFAEFMDLMPLSDPSHAVQREILLAIHEFRPDRPSAADAQFARTWAQLAEQYDGRDRWLLEALGIAAEGRWDQCIAALEERMGRPLASDSAMRDVIWRSRGSTACNQIAAALTNSDVPDAEAPRLLRGLDFQPDGAQQRVLRAMAFNDHPGLSAKRIALLRSESLNRLQAFDASRDERVLALLDEVLQSCAGSEQFVRLVNKFSVAPRYPDLVQLVQSQSGSQLAVDALMVLYGKEQTHLLGDSLRSDNADMVESTLRTMAAAGDIRGNDLLVALLADAERPLSVKRLAVRALGATQPGAQTLVEMAKLPDCPLELRDAMAATLVAVNWPLIREAAAAIFPAPVAKDNRTLPALIDLSAMKGDAARGKVVFSTAGNCIACHQPNEAGKDIGPNLSAIGAKLARPALFESILFPSAAINHDFETLLVTTSDGLSHRGLVVSETEAEIKLKNENGIVRSIPVDEIEEKQKLDVSLMPANIQQQLSVQDLVDLVEYLTTLTGDAKAS